MSIFTDLYESFTQRIADAVADRVLTERGRQIANTRAFRMGIQPRQLKVKPGQYDDNLILNFTGLIIRRSVSQMVGGGIAFRFNLPDVVDPATGETRPAEDTDDPPQKRYIEGMWDANKQEILCHRLALAAAEAGTGFVLLMDPRQGMDSMVGNDGVEYPRLMLLDPAFVTMETLPEDYEMVIRYIVRYKYIDVAGKAAERKKVIEQDPETGWVIVDYERSYATGYQEVETGRLEWVHDFSPVVHWQNLPTIDTPDGEPDITADMMEVQNKLNGDVSFLSKALRLGVHPMRWGKNLGELKELGTGPDKMLSIGSDGEVGQLTPEVDWPGAESFFRIIRASLFDLGRTVDIDSFQDKIGSMTNFGLRVLYQDNINKIQTKRELMGDALEEINRRCQLMAGFEPIDTDVIWQDFLPVNKIEDAQYYQALIGLGIVSKQTIAEKLDLDWQQEEERMGGEKEATDNLGAFLLRSFNQGDEAGTMPPLPPRNGQTPV